MEDEYLDRAYKRNMQETVIVEKIDDYKVKYTCPKCNYKFQYDITKKYPARCPYCDAQIARIRY